VSGGVLVLVADDDPLVRMTLRLKFEAEGYRVDLASNVEEASWLLFSYPYELVVADLDLGKPGSGLEIVRAARKLRPHAPILVLAESTDPADRREAVAAGASAVLGKPYRLAAVVGEARSLLKASRREDQA